MGFDLQESSHIHSSFIKQGVKINVACCYRNMINNTAVIILKLFL